MVPRSWQDPGPFTLASDTGPVWFSCTTAGAEGDPAFTGRVVGWTSNGTAWMVVGEDDEMAEAIVGALREAAP